MAAGIPDCILNTTGHFIRNVLAKDEHNNTVELVTIERKGATTVTYCSAVKLKSAKKLVFKMSNEDQQEAHERARCGQVVRGTTREKERGCTFITAYVGNVGQERQQAAGARGVERPAPLPHRGERSAGGARWSETSSTAARG